MKIAGIFEKPVEDKKEKFYLRLVPASSYNGAVSVEAVDKYGNRISLICRISTEVGIEMYSSVEEKLGFPMDSVDDTVVVSGESTV